MTENQELDPSPVVPEVAAGDGFAGRLADLVAKPARLMDRVGRAPRWWQASLLVVLLIGAFTWVILPISGPEQMELMRDSKFMRMMPEDQWQKMYDEALYPTPLKRALSAVQGAVTTVLMITVFGLVLGFFVRMGGGRGSFRQALGVTAWASLIPFGIGTLIKAPLVLATESVFRASLGLAAVLPDGNPSSPLYQVLMTYGDFVTWWGLFVLVIGFQQVFHLSRGAAATTVLLTWALLSAIPLGISLLVM